MGVLGNGQLATVTNTLGHPPSTQPDMVAHSSLTLRDAVIGGCDRQGVCAVQMHAISDPRDDLGRAYSFP